MSGFTARIHTTEKTLLGGAALFALLSALEIIVISGASAVNKLPATTDSPININDVGTHSKAICRKKFTSIRRSYVHSATSFYLRIVLPPHSKILTAANFTPQQALCKQVHYQKLTRDKLRRTCGLYKPSKALLI